MRLLITAGPTREPIDDVRFLSNRSSGQLGAALARVGVELGHDVTLLLGAGATAPPESHGVSLLRFSSTRDLQAQLAERFPRCDCLIMAAAVADYRPVQRHAGKLPRNERGNVVLELEPTPDLVAECAASKKPGQKVIAFALEEPGKLETRALEKLRRKAVDAIVANPLQTMDAGDIDAVLFTADGRRLSPGPLPKPVFARWLLAALEQL